MSWREFYALLVDLPAESPFVLWLLARDEERKKEREAEPTSDQLLAFARAGGWMFGEAKRACA